VFSKESLEKDLAALCEKKGITLPELKKMVTGSEVDDDIIAARALLLTLSTY
jgi:hypothetical protein